ncbi:MAG: hypothetical protein WC511_02620 [Candidatus Pacearchaeota archaeon]
MSQNPNKKLTVPKMLENPDFTQLKKVVQEYIDYTQSDKYHDDNDFCHYIFEAAMTDLLGKNIFDKYINKLQTPDID